MSSPNMPSKNKPGIWQSIRPLFEFNNHTRPWGFLVTVALAIGAPALIGAWLGHFAVSIAGSLGGLTIVYLRQTSLSHRMVTMAVVTVGFCASFTLSLLAGFNPWLMALVLCFVSFWATFICRYYAVPPPGSFFFIVVACIGSALPFDFTLLNERAGMLLFGCMGASLLALGYSLIQLMRGQSNTKIQSVEATEPRVIAIFLEAATIAIFVSLSYIFALLLGFDKPYWVPISCAAILQGASFRLVRQRNIHRIVGTAIGMGLTWMIFSLNPGPWSLAILIIVLSFIIEILITRNYGFAVIFITPLTIILAEADSASLDINWLFQLRMIDVVLGSVVGYIGGWVIHQQNFYDRLEQRLQKLR